MKQCGIGFFWLNSVKDIPLFFFLNQYYTCLSILSLLILLLIFFAYRKNEIIRKRYIVLICLTVSQLVTGTLSVFYSEACSLGLIFGFPNTIYSKEFSKKRIINIKKGMTKEEGNRIIGPGLPEWRGSRTRYSNNNWYYSVDGIHSDNYWLYRLKFDSQNRVKVIDYEFWID